jgi:hypothetical protein
MVSERCFRQTILVFLPAGIRRFIPETDLEALFLHRKATSVIVCVFMP